MALYGRTQLCINLVSPARALLHPYNRARCAAPASKPWQVLAGAAAAPAVESASLTHALRAVRILGKGPGAFTQSEIKAAVKGAIDAGMAVARVEIAADGKIVIIAAGGFPGDANDAVKNEWDEVFDGSGEDATRQ
jgi:hypothetical protein